jgi:hypothetical protein
MLKQGCQTAAGAGGSFKPLSSYIKQATNSIEFDA